MSESYQPVAYLDVSQDQAASVLDQIEAGLRASDFITGPSDPSASYNTATQRVFRPGKGSGVETETHGGFTSVNGVVLLGPNYVNKGPFIAEPYLDCPACKAEFAPFDEEAEGMQDRCAARCRAFYEGDPARDLVCESCQASSDINDWMGPREFAVSHVVVEFWNWTDDEVDRAIEVMDAATGLQAFRGGGVMV